MSDEIMRAIGRLEGKVDGLVDGQKAQDGKLDKLDGRLRSVERRSAANGAIAGGVVGVGVLMIKETLKNFTNGGA